MEPVLICVAAFLISFGGQFPFRWLGERVKLSTAVLQSTAGFVLALGLCLPLWLAFHDLPQMNSLFLLLAAAFLAGMLADLFRLSRWVQLFMGLTIALWAAKLGFLIEELKPPFFTRFIDLGSWAIPVTVLWILAVVFAVILCRRLPGLTSGLVAIVSLAFLVVIRFVFAAASPITTPLASALAGASLGAFPHGVLLRIPQLADTTKRRLPVLPQGGAGHWVLGFALALLSVIGFLKNTAFLVLAAPLLLLGVPIFEATYALAYGGSNKRFLFSLTRRRELLHEALLRGGLSPRRCIAVFLGITLYFSAVAVLLAAMVRVSFLLKLLVLLVAGLIGVVIFFLAARLLSRRTFEPSTEDEKLDFLDIPVAALDMNGALRKIEAFIQTRTPHMVVTSDSSAVIRARKDTELADIIRTADLVTPDGTGVVWMAKVLGLPIEQRVSGIDLLERICQQAAQKKWRIYLLGGTPGVAQEAAQRLAARYPGLLVVGCMHGYFSAEEEPNIVAEIAASKPDVLFVGFGIPLQEKWIARHLQKLGTPVAIGVGGSFDVISGRLKRAPLWMQKSGLEWLYRTIQEPKRLPRLLALPNLLFLTLKRVYDNRKRKKPS